MRATPLWLRLSALVLSGTLIPGGPVRAQSGAGGQFELGTYGVLTVYDDTAVALDRRAGAGGRLGWHLTRVFAVELSGDHTITATREGDRQVDVTRAGGTLLVHARLPIGATYLGAGVERLHYRGAKHADDDGVHVILGERISLGGRAALRLEGRAAYFTNSSLSAGDRKPLNLSGALGISVFAFGGPLRDSDRDKVADGDDRCPDTPAGAVVDAQGCPTDEDRDGVFDGLDNCPGTPSGAFVDSGGCPSDADRDGVFDGIDVCPNTPLGAVVDTEGCPLDGDHDGVFDGLDRCGNTPTGAVVDASGCPLDGDSDGVFDGLDQCPDTPLRTVVNAAGCPADADGDGVPDAADQCPDTPAGAEVDARGCSVERDSDGDGVPDARDRCPNTAPRQPVDAAGCAVLFVVEEGRRRPLILTGVQFASGSATLTPESHETLDQVAASLLAYPEIRIEIAGHTDNTGRRAVNVRLSLQRAEAVKAYLVSRGVDPARMEARGYGPDRPVASNATPAGRAENRRVELHPLESRQQQP